MVLVGWGMFRLSCFSSTWRFPCLAPQCGLIWQFHLRLVLWKDKILTDLDKLINGCGHFRRFGKEAKQFKTWKNVLPADFLSRSCLQALEQLRCVQKAFGRLRFIQLLFILLDAKTQVISQTRVMMLLHVCISLGKRYGRQKWQTLINTTLLTVVHTACISAFAHLRPSSCYDMRCAVLGLPPAP